MSKHSRLITAILSAMLLVSAAVYAVSAEEISEGGDQPGESYVEPSYDEPSYIEPSYDEPSYDEPSYVEPSYDEPSYDEPSYIEPSYDDPGYTDQISYDDNTVFYDGDGNQYSNPNDVYVGGEQTYTPPATIPETTVAPKDTSKTKVDEPTLKASDWDTIRANLSNQGKNTDTVAGTPNFRQIKTSVSTGQYDIKYLVIGIGLVLLSLLGFTYVIVSAVKRRKSTGIARANKAAASGSGMRYRADDDYDDNYETTGKKTKKPKNGKRYK